MGISAHVESEDGGGGRVVEEHLLYPRLSGLQLYTWPLAARTATSCTQADHLFNWP